MTINDSSHNDQLYYHEYILIKNDLYEEEILVNGGTSTLANSLYIDMNVSSQNDKVIRQSERYYIANINNIIHLTFACILNSLNDSTGYTTRIGIYDDHTNKTAGNDVGGSGYFFVLIDGILNVGYRTGTTDNGTDVLISQDNFNELELNLNHYDSYYWAQLHEYRIEYTSTGEVHFLIEFNKSEFVLVHKIELVDSQINLISRYNLPFRYEIEKTGTQGNNGSLYMYAVDMHYLDKFTYKHALFNHVHYLDHYQIKFADDILNNGYFAINDTDYIPLFSLRLNTSSVRQNIYNLSFYLHIKSEGLPFIIGIVKNGTFTGPALSWQTIPNSYLEYDLNASTLDQANLNFIEKHDYYIIEGEHLKPHFLHITSNIAGDPNVFTICARKIGTNNPNIIVSTTWHE